MMGFVFTPYDDAEFEIVLAKCLDLDDIGIDLLERPARVVRSSGHQPYPEPAFTEEAMLLQVSRDQVGGAIDLESIICLEDEDVDYCCGMHEERITQAEAFAAA